MKHLVFIVVKMKKLKFNYIYLHSQNFLMKIASYKFEKIFYILFKPKVFHNSTC